MGLCYQTIIQHPWVMKKKFQKIWKSLMQKAWFSKSYNVLNNSVKLFSKHDTSTQSGALSYFTIFSIAPMLFIIISVAGAILGPEAIEGEIRKQTAGLMGHESAVSLQNFIKSAYKPGKNILFTIIAAVVLALGATGMFGQLRTALNTIWDIKPSAKKPVIKFFLTKLFSFAMIACMTFLLLITLVVQSGLEAFSGYLMNRLPDVSVVLLKLLDVAIGLGVTTVLFAFVYKFMSDAKPKWRNIWWGALFTAVLFGIGRYGISLYLGRSTFTTTYGAGASIVIIMVWVYYSSQIFFFGAEFTRALAIQKGVMLDPHATESNEDVGISTKRKKVLEDPKQPEPKTRKRTTKKQENR